MRLGEASPRAHGQGRGRLGLSPGGRPRSMGSEPGLPTGPDGFGN